MLSQFLLMLTLLLNRVLVILSVIELMKTVLDPDQILYYVVYGLHCFLIYPLCDIQSTMG